MSTQLNENYLGMAGNVLKIDYIKGPGMKDFNIDEAVRSAYVADKKKTSRIPDFEFDKRLILNPDSRFQVPKTTQLVANLVELYAQLEKPIKNGYVPLFSIDDVLALYRSDFRGVDFVLTDSKGRKYIQLNEDGVKFFKREILGANSNYVPSKNETPLCVLPKEGRYIVLNAAGLGEVVADMSVGPSLLELNTTESLGLTPDYTGSDDLVTGDRSTQHKTLFGGINKDDRDDYLKNSKLKADLESSVQQTERSIARNQIKE